MKSSLLKLEKQTLENLEKIKDSIALTNLEIKILGRTVS